MSTEPARGMWTLRVSGGPAFWTNARSALMAAAAELPPGGSRESLQRLAEAAAAYAEPGGERDGDAGAQWPDCPECGGPAVQLEAGVTTRIRTGMAPLTTQRTKGGDRLRCAEGHYFTVDGHSAGPPIDITVREGLALGGS